MNEFRRSGRSGLVGDDAGTPAAVEAALAPLRASGWVAERLFDAAARA